METKTRKKTRTSNLKFESVITKGFSEKEMAKYFEEEATMFNHDRLIRETYEKKNELESYIYDIRQKLSDKLKDYTTQDVINSFFKLLSENEEWLYGEGTNSSKSSFVQRIENLKKIGDPIKKRWEEYTQLPELVNELLKGIAGYEGFATSKVNIIFMRNFFNEKFI